MDYRGYNAQRWISSCISLKTTVLWAMPTHPSLTDESAHVFLLYRKCYDISPCFQDHVHKWLVFCTKASTERSTHVQQEITKHFTTMTMAMYSKVKRFNWDFSKTKPLLKVYGKPDKRIFQSEKHWPNFFFNRKPRRVLENSLNTQFLISLQVNNTQYKCESQDSIWRGRHTSITLKPRRANPSGPLLHNDTCGSLD